MVIVLLKTLDSHIPKVVYGMSAQEGKPKQYTYDFVQNVLFSNWKMPSNVHSTQTIEVVLQSSLWAVKRE